MAITRVNAETGRLRNECLDEAATPEQRLRAGRRLLKIARSERNAVAVRRVIAACTDCTDTKIAKRVQRLKVQLDRALDEQRVVMETKRASSEMESNPIVGNLNLLPGEARDPLFWDRPGSGNSLRKQLCVMWGVSEDATHDEIVTAIVSDPERLEAHVVKRQMWACSTPQLDDRFAQDTEELNRIIAARGASWCDAELGSLTVCRRLSLNFR